MASRREKANANWAQLKAQSKQAQEIRELAIGVHEGSDRTAQQRYDQLKKKVGKKKADKAVNDVAASSRRPNVWQRLRG